MFNTIPNNPFPPSSQSAGAGGSYVLPVASANTLGGVKVGDNLSITNGVLSVSFPSYSTNVFDTGRKWVNDKNLFCKIIDLGNLPNASTKSVVAGISDYDVLTLDGWYQGASVSNIFNLASLQNFVYDKQTDSVVVNVSTDLSSFKAFAIIYCTEKESEV